MELHTLLDSLSSRGAVLSLKSGVVNVRPRSVLTDNDRAAIREHKPALLSLLQSTLAPPGLPPRDGATWDAEKCVWRWRHWIMRTPASIALERALLARQDSELMALPEIYRNPATPQSTLAISSLDTMKNEQTLKTDKTPEANHVDSM